MPEATTAVPATPPATHEDEFYVGYVPRAPRGVAARVAGAVAVQAAAAAVLAFLLALAMRDPGDGLWQSGRFIERTGVLRMNPYPVLETDSGETILLVEIGKIGAQARIAPHADRRARISGSLLSRAGLQMIELAPDDAAIAVLDPAPVPAPAADDLGPATLRGEIVDPKCFLGAMKPGEGKTHKACAALCIRGGIPPVLAMWDAGGRAHFCLLIAADRSAVNDHAAAAAGETVVLSGRLERRAGLLRLRIDPQLTPALTRP